MNVVKTLKFSELVYLYTIVYQISTRPHQIEMLPQHPQELGGDDVFGSLEGTFDI